MARASSKLATLAQAMSSTKLTAPMRTRSEERTLPTSGFANGLDAEALVGLERALGYLRMYSSAEALKRAPGLLERDAGFKAAGGLEVVALVGGVGIELEGDIDVGSGSRSHGSRSCRERCR